MPHLAIFDIDGTLAVVGDRLQCLSGSRKDYDSFYARVREDRVNEPIRSILWALRRSGWKIVFVTGRPERTRMDTLAWLSANAMYADSEDLYMRKDRDFRKDYIIKEELCKDFADDVELVFEDRAGVCKMWRDIGKTCVQVADGDY